MLNLIIVSKENKPMYKVDIICVYAYMNVLVSRSQEFTSTQSQ